MMWLNMIKYDNVVEGYTWIFSAWSNKTTWQKAVKYSLVYELCAEPALTSLNSL